MNPTILFAHPSDDRYGADVMLVHSARAMTRAGYRVLIGIPGGGPRVKARMPSATMLDQDVPILRQALLRDPLGIARFLLGSTAAILRLGKLIQVKDPCVVLVNTVTIPAWIIASWMVRRPVVVHVHELESDRARWTRKLLYAPLLFATHILVPSHAVYEAITSCFKVLAGRISILHNPVAVLTSRPAPSPRGATLNILLVGRLSHRKGQHVAVEAMRLLRHRGIDARLTLVGAEFGAEGTYTRQLNSRIDAAGLRDCVELLGHCDDVSRLYATHDVVVVPSTRPEPLGLVALEGAAAARPVIASATGGLCEVVENELTGYLIPPGDPNALADRLSDLVRSSWTARTMGYRGWQFAKRHFSIEQYDKRFTNLIQEIASRSHRKSL